MCARLLEETRKKKPEKKKARKKEEKAAAAAALANRRLCRYFDIVGRVLAWPGLDGTGPVRPPAS